MTDHMFDKFVKDKLGDHQSPVPQGLWEKIERKKDKEPKGGFLLPGTFLRAGLLLVVLIGVLWFVLQDNSSSDKNKNAQDETAAANTNSGVISEKTSAAEQEPVAGNDSNNETSAGEGEGNGKKDDALNNNNINTGTNDRATNGAAGTGVAYTITKKHSTVNTGKESMSKNSGSDVTARNLYSGKSNQVTRRKNSLEKENHNPVLAHGDDISITPGEYNTLSLSRGATAYHSRNLGVNAKDKFDLSRLSLFGIDCPTTGTPRRNDWYLEVYGSPDITMKSVTAKGNATYVQKKDSTESQQGGFTAGLRISKSIGENLLIKTGLQYSQINERFDLRTENERRIITVVTIRTIITSGGTDSTVRDTSTVEQIGYRLQRTYNRYRSIDIPLLLSYEFGNDKIKFGLNAGVILNLYSWYNGQALNDSLNVVSLNSKSTPIYKQNIGMGLYAGFSIIKPVSPKTEVFLEPYFRYNLSNMATGSAYSQKFHAGGINLGIRYQLKGQRRGIK